MPLQSFSPSRKPSAPFSVRTKGRAHWLIAGSLVVISALWIGSGAVKGSASAQEQAMTGSIANAKNAADDARAAANSRIEVMRVTAPRVAVPVFTFEEPNMDLALGTPETPARHWTNSDS